MQGADTFALAGTKWDTQFLEDSSLRDLVLEYYDREHVSLERYVSFLGVDSDICRDIVQESFLRLHEHLLANGDRTNLRAWLYRVAHNLSRNGQTASHVSKTSPMTALVGVAEPVARTVSPEQMLLQQERQACLKRAIDDLSPAQKECLLLRAQGFKYREIADILSLSVSTAAEIVGRALERLKKAV
jgi:RNA polymerase sigma-70 factor (ECF subfamily)